MNLKKQSRIGILLPVFMSFYIMGFVDLVGVATAYVKEDFQLSDSVAQILPSMVFLWFALISIPTGIFQDRKGKKLTAAIGIALTGAGMIVPFIHYSYLSAILGFMILGIGNTILQVSANPLLLDVSGKGREAANLSLSQFVKALASMSGPLITAAFASWTGNWKLIFPLYAAVSLIALFWLYSVKIEESRPEKEPASFLSVISLFKNPFVVIVVLSTFLMVGFDVGINSNIAIYLQHRFDIGLETASIGISIYFASLTIGRFMGGVFLRKANSLSVLLISVMLTLTGLAGIILSDSLILTRVMIVVTGLGFSNTFPLVFAIAVNHLPKFANEISSLIILSVAGGAFIPPLMGYMSDNLGYRSTPYVLVLCMVYLFFATLYFIRLQKKGPEEK